MRPFHLAFPVTDLGKTEHFYVDVLDCKIGRRTPNSVNFDFFGHQIVAHKVSSMPRHNEFGDVDDKKVPPFHFGLVMHWENWHETKDRLEKMKVNFRIKPHIRYPGKIGEQATLFIDDPSGNAIELKAFQDDSRLFATTKDGANEVGGGNFNPSK